ncbi:hypothetical protein [uncultured Arcticibacterium sp.]|uniref:hypothetical protein n=1 Tax=uncultured Arcticibacterium sp. TaxID=2173042 RepID=UPI0030F560B2
MDNSLKRLNRELKRNLYAYFKMDVNFVESYFQRLNLEPNKLNEELTESDKKIMNKLEMPHSVDDNFRIHLKRLNLIRPCYQHPKAFLDVCDRLIYLFIMLFNIEDSISSQIGAITLEKIFIHKKYIATKNDLRTHASVRLISNHEYIFDFNIFFVNLMKSLSYFISWLFLGVKNKNTESFNYFDNMDEIVEKIGNPKTRQWLVDIYVHAIAREKWALVETCEKDIINSSIFKTIYESMQNFLFLHEIGHIVLGHLEQKPNKEQEFRFEEDERTHLLQLLTEHNVPSPEIYLDEFESNYASRIMDEIQADNFAFKYTTLLLELQSNDYQAGLIGIYLMFNILDWFEDFGVRKNGAFGKKISWVDDIVNSTGKTHPFAFTRLSSIMGKILENSQEKNQNKLFELFTAGIFSLNNAVKIARLEATVLLEKLEKSNGDFSILFIHDKFRKVTDHNSIDSIRELEDLMSNL